MFALYFYIHENLKVLYSLGILFNIILVAYQMHQVYNKDQCITEMDTYYLAKAISTFSPEHVSALIVLACK